jgi:hypothetical protein
MLLQQNTVPGKSRSLSAPYLCFPALRSDQRNHRSLLPLVERSAGFAAVRWAVVNPANLMTALAEFAPS